MNLELLLSIIKEIGYIYSMLLICSGIYMFFISISMYKKKQNNQKKIYIAGPITGLEYKAALRNFNNAEEYLKTKYNFKVINPMSCVKADLNKTWEDYLKEDIKLLVECDYIYMLPGWYKSKGAILERHIAKKLNINLIF